jgi:hypothetical protein
MLNYASNDLKATAEKILEMHPDPVPRFRLLRDVLHLDPVSADYRKAQNALQESKWIALLQNTQQPDGTWGRFHTQDTKIKQPFATTEAAIRAALDSGLDRYSPILQKTQKALEDYVVGKTCWPDPPEKHDNPLAWFVWVRHYSAAVLSQIDPHHPLLEEFWNTWAEAVTASFRSGSYDRQREIKALNELLNCRMKNPVPFHVMYPLLILSATDNRLPGDLERQLLDYVLRSPRGIYYMYDKTLSLPLPILSKHFWSWTQAHRLLSRFRLWRELAEEVLSWIWDQRNAAGFWDLGSQISRKPYSSFPLSESWKRAENRLIDCSVEMLTLLARGLG